MATLPFPQEPRFERCSTFARTFISDAGIYWLPVDPFNLYKQFDWVLLTCDEAEKFHSDFMRENFDWMKIDAKTYKKKGYYITVYNDKVLADRIRWTLAHEIGHIILGHLDDFGETCIYRGARCGLTYAKYKILETEAHTFAAELLCPNPVLHDLGISKSDEIARVCQVSQEAAGNRIQSLKKFRSSWIKTKIYKFYRKQFEHYLEPVSICTNASFGYRTFPFSLAKKTSEVEYVKPKNAYVETDASTRFLVCPRCGNNRFSEEARFCRICGLYLYSECTNENGESHYGECGARVSGDARYCELCGAPTILLRQGLLMTWEEVLQVHEEIAAGLVPVVTSEEDEEVPF